MCYIGSAAVTYLTSMTGGARPKIAMGGPSMARYCMRSRSHAHASGKAIKALFIASCFPTLIRLPRLLSPPRLLSLSLCRRKIRISGRRLWLWSCIVFSLQTAALPHSSDLRSAHGSPPTSIESWVAKWKREEKNKNNNKETQCIINFEWQRLPAVTRWEVY